MTDLLIIGGGAAGLMAAGAACARGLTTAVVAVPYTLLTLPTIPLGYY